MAENPLPPEEIPEYGKITPEKGFEKETKIKPPDSQAFQSFMKEPAAPSAETPAGITPLDLTKAPTAAAAPSLENILTQVSDTSFEIQKMQNNLSTPNLRFKSSQARLLESKLYDAKSHIAAASERLGAPLVPDTSFAAGTGPIAKFIGLLTDGQSQLMAAKAQVESLKASGENLKPAELLLIQIKLSQAQQEIEYSSILLSKAVDIIKQMINIPL